MGADDWAKETAHLASAMTSPSTYQFDFINITNLVVVGGGVDQYDTSNRFVAMDTVWNFIRSTLPAD